MTDESVQSSANTPMQVLAEDARKKSEQEHRRSLEIRVGFYEKLSVLAAGSIAVTASAGIALLSKSDARFGSLHSHLGWLLWTSATLWISLLSSVGHNSMFVNIARLEAAQAGAWSKYLALIAAQASASGQGAELLTKHLVETFHKRVVDTATNAHRVEQTLYRSALLGKLAVAAFLSAYTLVMFAVIQLWWVTR